MSFTFRALARDAALKTLVLPHLGERLDPDQAKNLGLMIAARGLGQVAPNPLVGCVILDRKERFVAAGFHERVGGPHAEVMALQLAQQTGIDIHGGIAYVTLEPCSHTGRTPPCAPLLAKSGLAKVVYGVIDPNPKVSGQGALFLESCGIKVQFDQAWSRACEDLAEVFLMNQRAHRPFVALKAAATFDGVLARPGDQRAWITGPRARSYGHFLRLHYDAIMVGRATVTADDPRLDARDSLWPGRAPKKVILDPALSAFHSELKLLKPLANEVYWLVHPHVLREERFAENVGILQKLGVQLLPVEGGNEGLFSAAAILKTLKDQGITSILLEGGAGLYQAFLKEQLVDRLYLFQAAKLWGSDRSTVFTSGAGPLSLSIPQLEMTVLDEDWLWEGRVAYGS